MLIEPPGRTAAEIETALAASEVSRSRDSVQHSHVLDMFCDPSGN